MPLSLLPAVWIFSGVLFIAAIRGLASPQSARGGNILGILGMATAVAFTIFIPGIKQQFWILTALLLGGIGGIYFALRVKMASLPQMIAVLNGLGGLAAVFIALAEIINGSTAYLDNVLGLIIGALTFSGSMVAFAKLQGLLSSRPLIFPFWRLLNLLLILTILVLTTVFLLCPGRELFYVLGVLGFLFGIMFILPVGGADMPIVISILNACSGWAAVGIGFSFGNVLLIVTGSIVGASGAILSYVMVKAMNRSLIKVLFGETGSESGATGVAAHQQARAGSPRDAAYLMENAAKIIIVPGYGMAAAGAQHILQKMARDLRELYDVDVKFAIHPVAGRMPGHMNVLLAEANVPYEDVFALEDINQEFATADIAYVIGANDITNPAAKTDHSSPLFGMPVFDVGKAKTVFFVKRSLGSGYSGVENPLFFAENTIMLYGDAKQITGEIVRVLEQK